MFVKIKPFVQHVHLIMRGTLNPILVHALAKLDIIVITLPYLAL